MKRRILVIAVLSFIGAMVLTFDQRPANANNPSDIVIIANKSVNASSVSISDLKRIFLKQKTIFGGGKIVPIHGKGALRKGFLRQYLGMDESKEESYWVEQKTKAGLAPPAEFGKPLKAVFSVKGGIGYCFRKDLKAGIVKALELK